MLDELFKCLYLAYKQDNKKEIKRITKVLNNNGCDNITINCVLSSLYYNETYLK